MVKKLTFSTLFLFFVIAGLTQSLSDSIDFSDLKTGSNSEIFIRSSNEKSIYFLGERSGLKDGKLIGLYTFKQLYMKNNAKLWVLNEPPSYVYFLNQYLRTGNEKYKSKILHYNGLVGKKQQKLFLDELYEFYINESNKDFTICSSNLQFEYDNSRIEAIQDIQKTKGKIPSEIEIVLNQFFEYISNKMFPPSKEKMNEVLDKILLGYSIDKEHYKNYLGDDFEVFKRLILSYKIYYNATLNYYSIEDLEKILIICFPDYINKFKDLNSNILMEVELPWIYLDHYSLNKDEAVRSLLIEIMQQTTNFDPVLIGILYPQVKPDKCKDCYLGLSDNTIEFINQSSSFKYTIFDIVDMDNDFFKYIISIRK